MKMIELLYGVILLVSFVLIYFAVTFYSKTKNLLNSGVKTKARVVDLIKISDEDGYSYKPVFEYVNLLDETVSFKSEVSTSPAPYQIGDKVEIIYSKTTDDRKVISFWGLYRWTIILLAIASPLLIISGGYFLYTRG